ncbi:MAG: hypothetical protein KJO98_01990, partial [Rhodothermia bacterium]|nr:hypothetical protein [Rhodothermia bacterium]
MTRRQDIDHLSTAYLFGDLTETERQRFDSLVDDGAIDLLELDDLRQTLNIVSLHEAPAPPDRFWDDYYANLQQRVDQRGTKTIATPRLRDWLSNVVDQMTPRVRLTAQVVFAATVLLVGILLGRTVLGPDADAPWQPTAAGADPAVELAADAAHQYLGRSKVLLLGIVHSDNGDAADLNLPRRKEMARELVRAAADLKPSLEDARMRRLHELVSEIEMIMIQIANLEAEYD